MNTTIKTFAAAALLGFPALASAQVASPIIPLPLNPVVDAAHRTCTAKTASGLGYTELRAAPAGAAKPGDADVVLINYLGYLAANGSVFDQAMRSPLPVSGVIAGFGEGMKLAGKGAVLRLCIPAAMGYGAQASGPIPANSDLVFQIEVLDFKSMAEIEAMQKQAEAQPAEK
ncbi:MAG: FKBP-type peptidyl-prolyl cis-trans isomerase [Novosphingobium sp.]